MELFITVYSLFFVLIPVTIASNRGQSDWAIALNLIVSMLITPVLFLFFYAGATFGRLEDIGMAIICLFLPYFLVFLMDEEKNEKTQITKLHK